ncbi:LOW QUALITY PROTEIN: serine-rich adhesin for platelets-like [Panonychus citri]|uniref:LOW QUALITY PROTEIN: serine-rich adhesin for platelets-like n=1 Tax=Panonychus citri TaxID=50023 RepID=UPI002306F4E7|nr:LOW QUALITY PROTEIN: serine-rich adhesin for platelets-like [Panonychus citri]
MAKLRSGIDDLVKLLEMVNEIEENGEEFTEEELRKAFIPEDNDAIGNLSEDFSSTSTKCPPLNLTNGKSPSSSTPIETSSSLSSLSSSPSTSSSPSSSSSPTTSSSSPSNQPKSNNNNNNNNNENIIIKDNINSTINPDQTKDEEKKETITGNGPINSPNNLNDNIVTTTVSTTNDDNVNNNQVNRDDDRSVTVVIGEQRKDEDKMLSDSGDDNVTNDSPFFTFSMVNHSITKDQSGKNLYHCYVCNAIYRHSFSLKRHFIRTHINYAFLCDADLANCSITLALSESHLAWISRLKSTLSTTATISNGENVSSPDTGQPSTSSGNPSSSASLVDSYFGSTNHLVSGNLDSSMLPSSSTVTTTTTETATYQPPKSKGLYCCHACVMFFDRIGFLRAHLREQHRSQNSDTLEAIRLPCHRCDMTFIQRAQLVRHLSSAHGLITSQPSSMVQPSVETSTSTSSSTITTTTTNTVGGIKRKKGSSSCSTTSSSSSSGCDQKNSSSEEKCDDEEEDGNSSSSQERNHLTCNQCPFKCKSPEQLKKHISSRHPINTLTCAYCKIQFNVKKQLIEHLSRVHSKSLVANSRLLKSMCIESTSLSTSPSTSTAHVDATTSTLSSSSSQRLKNTISTRSLKRRRANRRGANYDADDYDDDLFECHECYAKFHIATELLKHAETVHNPTRSTRSVNNNASYRDESAFYQSLAQKISENLLFYVDGKPKVQPDNDCNNNNNNNNTTGRNSTSTNNCTDKPNESSTNQIKLLNLQDYNFPPGFKLYADDDDDCDITVNEQKSTNGGSIAQVNNNNNNNNLSMINNDNSNTIKDKETESEKDNKNITISSTTSTTTTTTTTDANNGLVIDFTNNQSTGTIDVKPGTLVFICNACDNYFLSLSDFDEHEINNHPNVFCSYTEIEYNPNIPVNIFRWQSYSPHGLLRSCKVPVIVSSSSEPSIKCTKCHNKFSTATELYQHILDCSSKSKRKSKPPIKSISLSISSLPITSSSSSPTIQPPEKNAITIPTAIMTVNDNQNIKPKLTISPQPKVPIISSSSPSPKSSTTITTTTATPSTSSCISQPSSSSSSSLISSTSSLSTLIKKKSSTKSHSRLFKTSSVRRSGQSQRSTTGTSSILDSLSYSTRSARKRENNDVDIDVDCGLSLVKKRIRKVRYNCTNCGEIFSHHLTFAKHRNHCLKSSTSVKEEKTFPCETKKTKNSDTSTSSSSSTTELSTKNAITSDAIITTINDNQNIKAKSTKSPTSLTTTATSSMPSSSANSSVSTLTNGSSQRKAQQKVTPVSSQSSTGRRSGQSPRSTCSNSILDSLSYSTRSRRRENNGAEIDLDCGLSLVKKRIRKVRYHCTNCCEIFSHHLTFAKHRNHCLKSSSVKEKKTVPSNTKKTKNSDTSTSSSSSSTTSSPSKTTKRPTHRVDSIKRRSILSEP